MKAHEITGRHVLFITVSCFAVVIGVNLTLAVQAVRTFPGLEVKNSYVASQTFDTDRAAQEALGWTVTARVEMDVLRLDFTSQDGGVVLPATFSATIGRATHVADDRTPDFRGTDGSYFAPMVLEPGLWHLRVAAIAEDGTRFRQRLSLRVPAP